MTVIAWDGKTLAADKRCTDVGLARTTTKIRRAPCGALLGGTGDSSVCRALSEWWIAGADPKTWPGNSADLLVITAAGQIHLFSGGGHPIVLEDQFTAIGCGRDYAIAAMHMGKSAGFAVELASLYDTGCGNGMDTLVLGERA